MLKVKEIFYSLQGEGHHTGRPAIFVRFAGCNLWSGKPEHKESSPCYFCDTDFNNGESMNEDKLIDVIYHLWPKNSSIGSFIIFTGGEPTLQITNSLLSNIALRLQCFGITQFAIETNGETDHEYLKDAWVTLSPKTIRFKRKKCNELKLLWPLRSIHPHDLIDVEADYRYLQPIHDDDYDKNLASALNFCLENPEWSLSLQQHKLLNIR